MSLLELALAFAGMTLLVFVALFVLLRRRFAVGRGRSPESAETAASQKER